MKVNEMHRNIVLYHTIILILYSFSINIKYKSLLFIKKSEKNDNS